LQIVGGEFSASGIAAGTLAAGFVSAFAVGCLACKFMIEAVKRGKLIWFAAYCAAVGLTAILSYIF